MNLTSLNVGYAQRFLEINFMFSCIIMQKMLPDCIETKLTLSVSGLQESFREVVVPYCCCCYCNNGGIQVSGGLFWLFATLLKFT